MSAFARLLCLATLPLVGADRPAVTLSARMEATGENVVRLSPARPGFELAPILQAVVHCPGRMKVDDELLGNFRCSSGLKRDGLTLEGIFDLAPLARELAAEDEIELWLDYPRLGFEASSVAVNGEGPRSRVIRTARFRAGDALAPDAFAPIRVQFGYDLDRLAVLYLPLAVLAVALTLIPMILGRAGRADLNRSVFLLGTMLWLCAALRLQAGDPIRVVLSGTPLANLAAVLVEYCSPLLCVAVGAALGNRKRADRSRGQIFADVIWGYGMFLFPLTIVFAAIPSIAGEDMIGATAWLVAAPVSCIVCRWRIRTNSGSSVRQLSGGELKERVSELAAKAGSRDVRVYISSSTRSQVFNAFAMPMSGILLTAPLVQSLTKLEVDAVAAHELSHLRHARLNPWAALAAGAVLFQMPLAELFPGAAGLSVSLLGPSMMFFLSLYGARRREFAADAGAVALIGDPRALISGLARITRNNSRPLDSHPVAEWFSTHPSTRKRIRALARAARLERAEVETLSSSDAPGESYTLPPEERTIFNPRWQNANATRYVWAMFLGASGAGLLAAWLLDEFAGAGVPQLAAGIVFGCALTKILATSVISANYARLRRKLTQKLGIRGQLVGLAVDSAPRVYNGYRFSDAGLLWFEAGRLHYRSERIAIALNPAAVVDVGMVAAAPASWRRSQPVVRFRHAESGEIKAFILHPVEWGASPQRLFDSIEQWRATATSAETTSISGLEEVAGRPFHPLAVAQTVREFRIPGGVTFVGVMLSGWMLRPDSWPAWYALAITACAYTFLSLPAMLYRPSSLPPPLPPQKQLPEPRL